VRYARCHEPAHSGTRALLDQLGPGSRPRPGHADRVAGRRPGCRSYGRHRHLDGDLVDYRGRTGGGHRLTAPRRRALRRHRPGGRRGRELQPLDDLPVPRRIPDRPQPAELRPPSARCPGHRAPGREQSEKPGTGFHAGDLGPVDVDQQHIHNPADATHRAVGARHGPRTRRRRTRPVASSHRNSARRRLCRKHGWHGHAGGHAPQPRLRAPVRAAVSRSTRGDGCC